MYYLSEIWKILGAICLMVIATICPPLALLYLMIQDHK